MRYFWLLKSRGLSNLLGALVAVVSSVFLYWQVEPEIFSKFHESIIDDFVLSPYKNDPGFAPDVVQMLYLVWIKSQAFLNGIPLYADPYMFASTHEVFKPVVLDPLVYLGGYIASRTNLAVGYNMSQVFLPFFLIAVFMFTTLRRLGISLLICVAAAILAPLVPERIIMSIRGQHIAASAMFLHFYFMCVVFFLTTPHRGWWHRIALALSVVLLSFSEEHLGYHAVLLGVPFVIAYILIVKHYHRQHSSGEQSLWKRILVDLSPLVLSLAGIVILGLNIRRKLLNETDVSRDYPYDIIKDNSADFFREYITGQTAFGYFILVLIGIGIALFATRRCFVGTATLPQKKAISAIFIVFIVSTHLSLGHIPAFEPINFQPYLLLFDYVPLFSMQRFPFRMSHFAFLTGIVVAANSAEFLIYHARQRSKKLAWAVMILLAGGFVFSAYRWSSFSRLQSRLQQVNKDHFPETREAIRLSVPETAIILQIPASKGDDHVDSRALEHIIYTKRRFFNGYFSFVSTAYREAYSHFAAIEMKAFDKDRASLFKDLGVEYLLVNRTFINKDSIFWSDTYTSLPHLELLSRKDPYLLYRIISP